MCWALWETSTRVTLVKSFPREDYTSHPLTAGEAPLSLRMAKNPGSLCQILRWEVDHPNFSQNCPRLSMFDVFLCFSRPRTWRMGSQGVSNLVSITPIYTVTHGVRPFGRGPTTPVRGLTITKVINHVSKSWGPILQPHGPDGPGIRLVTQFAGDSLAAHRQVPERSSAFCLLENDQVIANSLEDSPGRFIYN